MVKFIEAPLEYHDFLGDWYELGSAFVERKYNLNDFAKKYLEDTKDNFETLLYKPEIEIFSDIKKSFSELIKLIPDFDIKIDVEK